MRFVAFAWVLGHAGDLMMDIFFCEFGWMTEVGLLFFCIAFFVEQHRADLVTDLFAGPWSLLH